MSKNKRMNVRRILKKHRAECHRRLDGIYMYEEPPYDHDTVLLVEALRKDIVLVGSLLETLELLDPVERKSVITDSIVTEPVNDLVVAGKKEPIHFSDGVDIPIGTPVLFAMIEECLGEYLGRAKGRYLGRAEDSKLFKVEVEHNKKIISTSWIAEY